MIYHFLGLLDGVQTTINYPYRKIVVTSWNTWRYTVCLTSLSKAWKIIHRYRIYLSKHNMISSTENQNINDICPYVGLRDDPQTAMNYASPLNCCHYIKSLASPNLIQQQKYCLKTSYALCALLATKSTRRIPAGIFKNGSKRGTRKRTSRAFWLILVLILLVTQLELLWDWRSSRCCQPHYSLLNKLFRKLIWLFPSLIWS